MSRSKVDHHRLVLRLGDQLAGRLVGDHLAVVDDGDAVAQLLGFLEVVGGEHHRHALAIEARGRSSTARGEARCRRRRSARRAPGSAANGPSPWRPAAAASCRPTGCGRKRRPCRSGASPPAARRSAARPAERRTGRPGSRALRAGLKNGSNRISCGTMPIERLALRGCSSMSKPQIVTLPLRFGDQPGEDVDQRRLAGAVGAEQPEDLPARHVEADVVERELGRAPLAGIGLGQGFDADCGVGGTHRGTHRHGPVRRQW